MMLAAMNWPSAIVLGTVIPAISFVIYLIVDHVVPARGSSAAIGPRRLDAIDDDLALIRADLADIKQSVAELDRLLKSVG